MQSSERHAKDGRKVYQSNRHVEKLSLDRQRAIREPKVGSASRQIQARSERDDTGEDSDASAEGTEDEEAQKAAERWARVRGLTGPQSSSASSSEDETESEEAAEGSESSGEEASLF